MSKGTNSENSRIKAFGITATSRLVDNSRTLIFGGCGFHSLTLPFPERDSEKLSWQRALFKLVDAPNIESGRQMFDFFPAEKVDRKAAAAFECSELERLNDRTDDQLS